MRSLPPFRYHRPNTLREALKLLESLDGHVKIAAGGTDLFVQIKDGFITPRHIVDIGHIDKLKEINRVDNTMRLGALTTHAEISTSQLLLHEAPILAQASASIGSTQIRNRGTIGGNLCNASPAADDAPPLLVLEAQLRIIGPEGEKSISIEEFFSGSGETCLKSNEILADIRFPICPNTGSSLIKLGRRKAYTLSTVSVAAFVKTRGEICEETRIALGSVAPTPIRARNAENILREESMTEDILEEVSRVVMNEVKPITDVRATEQYRREMAGVLVKRALEKARGSQ